MTPRVVDLPNGRVDVVFTINEGDKTGIKAINFVGNRAYSSSRLRDLMTSTEMNFLSFLKNTRRLRSRPARRRPGADPPLLPQERLRRFPRRLATDAQFDAARGGWIVTITVEEGEQYRVGAVQLDSRLGDVDPETLRRRIRTVAGQVYNAEAVERSLTDVTTEVARRGYAFAQVRPTGMRDPATRTINIGYVVEEGPRVYIERINVRGNTRTRDYVIRRELDLGEGDAYNKVLLDRAERRLNNLGYFKKVRITNEPGSAPGPRRSSTSTSRTSRPARSRSPAATRPPTASSARCRSANRTSSAAASSCGWPAIGASAPRASISPSPSRTSSATAWRRASTCSRSTATTPSTRATRAASPAAQLRLGLPVTEEFGFTLRYSLFQTELKIPNTIKQPYNDCAVPIPGYTVLNPATITCRIPLIRLRRLPSQIRWEARRFIRTAPMTARPRSPLRRRPARRSRRSPA